MKTKSLQALHSSATPEHGTPPDVIEAARRVMGGIDLDPASSDEFQKAAKANVYYTRQEDGLAQEWADRVFLNPPSGENVGLVKRFWDKLQESYLQGDVREAIYLGFSIDQLQTLQRCPDGGPLQYPICVPSKRLRFHSSLETHQENLFGNPDPTPVKGNSPTKPNFICYLPPKDQGSNVWQAIERFRDEFSRFGEVRI